MICDMCVRLYEEQAARKEQGVVGNGSVQKKKCRVYNSNSFVVFNLWYAYVVMKCFTTTTTIYIMNKMACILTRSSDRMADSSSYEVFKLVWVMYQLTKINKYDERITCMLTRGNEQMVGNE